MPDLTFCSSPGRQEAEFESLTTFSDIYSGSGTAPSSPKDEDQASVTGRVKRPMNPFMVWAKQERPRLSQQQPGVHNAELSRLLGERWRRMTDLEKRPYRLAAQRLADQHKREHPDYKYRPRKKDPTVRRVRGRRIKREEISRAVRSMTREQISAYVGLVLDDDCSSSDEADVEESKPTVSQPARQAAELVQSVPTIPSTPVVQRGGVSSRSDQVKEETQRQLAPCNLGKSQTSWDEQQQPYVVDAMIGSIDLSNVLLMQSSSLYDNQPVKAESTSLVSTPDLDIVDWLDDLCSSTDESILTTSRWSSSTTLDEVPSTASSLGQCSPDWTTGDMKFGEWL